jgi:hypothetical protein
VSSTPIGYLRMPVLAEPRHHPQRHALDQHAEVRATRRRRRDEAQRRANSGST